MTGAEIALGAGALAAAAGTGVAAVGQANQAKYQAKVQDQQAAQERAQAEIDASRFLKEQRRTLGTARALRAASGVIPGTGSALLSDEDLVGEIALNAARIRRGGAVRATRLEQEAALLRSGRSSTLAAGGLKSGGTLLTGFSEFR